jgi:hypothetical protein
MSGLPFNEHELYFVREEGSKAAVRRIMKLVGGVAKTMPSSSQAKTAQRFASSFEADRHALAAADAE